MRVISHVLAAAPLRVVQVQGRESLTQGFGDPRSGTDEEPYARDLRKRCEKHRGDVFGLAAPAVAARRARLVQGVDHEDERFDRFARACSRSSRLVPPGSPAASATAATTSDSSL